MFPTRRPQRTFSLLHSIWAPSVRIDRLAASHRIPRKHWGIDRDRASPGGRSRCGLSGRTCALPDSRWQRYVHSAGTLDNGSGSRIPAPRFASHTTTGSGEHVTRRIGLSIGIKGLLVIRIFAVYLKIETPSNRSAIQLQSAEAQLVRKI